tara:strand:- start:123 stop:1028 length:906 start_codon:yes stop_codon:yes gene_type:complete
MTNIFKQGDPGSNNMANKGLQFVDIYHVPTGRSIQFKALLTEFNDQYTSEWDGVTSFGRMDAIQNFKRTGRSISIGFDVVAYSLSEAQENMSKISSLAQFLYPGYDSFGQISNSPLCKIQFKNWSFNADLGSYSTAKVSGLLGAIGGFSFAPDLDAGVYNDEDGGKVNPSGNIYSKKTTISFEFAVIHQHKLGWQKSTDDWSPRADFGELFPYGADTSGKVIFNDTGPTPESTAQQKAVPNDAKDQQTANSLTDDYVSPLSKEGIRRASTPERMKAKQRSLMNARLRRQHRLHTAKSWDEE